MRKSDLYDVLVVSNQYLGKFRELGLSYGWIEVPRGVSQPLGALIDLFRDVDYDSDVDDFSYSVGLTAFHAPINDRLYKLVDDEDLTIERGVEDGLYSVFLKKTKRFKLHGMAHSNYYFNEVVDGVRQKTDYDFLIFSLPIVDAVYDPEFIVEKQIRYTKLVNKYLRDGVFACNSFLKVGKDDKRAKYTTARGNTCYMGIEFVDGRVKTSLKLYLDPDEFTRK